MTGLGRCRHRKTRPCKVRAETHLTVDLVKYLEFLQAAITRLASNSFQLKGWSVALGIAIIGLTAKDSQPQLAWFAIIPTLAFWGLDAYYLALERRFRDLYNNALGGGYPPTFNMVPETATFGLWLGQLRRPAVLWVHFPIIVLGVLVAMYGFHLLPTTPTPTKPSSGLEPYVGTILTAPSVEFYQ
jgi:hypothetical protein